MIAFVFDVESIGLHGEPYAAGWVVIDSNGEELSWGRLAVPPEIVHGDAEDRSWCASNIPPISATHVTLEAMLYDFWIKWLEWKSQGALMFAECAWPVEAKFLSMCVGVMRSKWDGPYPLHEISSFMLAAEMDPMATYERLPEEEPKHDPLADARQSARLLLTALSKIHV